MADAKPYVDEHLWGVISPFGEIWSPHVFGSRDEAVDYVKAFWKGHPERLAGYDFEKVRVTIERIPEGGSSNAG